MLTPLRSPRAARHAAALSLLLAGVAAAPTLAAQGRVLVPCATTRPDLAGPRPCPAQVVRLATRTLIEVDGRVARTTITETFENRGGPLGEADVVYPLPSGAAFEELRLEINGELVRGEVLDATSARATYERIVREQRDPALVEWAGLGLLRTRIFPFGAGERRTIVLRYRSLPPRDGDALRVTARFAGGDDPRDETADSDVRLRWRESALGTPWSPTHDVRLREAAARSARPQDARLPDGWREARLTGRASDVVAYLPLRRDDASVGVTVLMHDERRPAMTDRARARHDRHALVIVSPPRVAPRALPRDLTLVLDVSGSMRGEKLRQAVAAGHAVLASLGPQDRVRLIAFSDDVRSHAPAPVAATAAATRAAARWLDALEAEGGTNIGGALAEALRADGTRAERNRADGTRLPFVLLLTDGQPTVGLRRDAILDSTGAWRGDARVFTFGLGADVDASLVEQLALDGRGAAHFVRPEESVERAVSLVAQRLTAPLLADVQLRVPGGELATLYAPLGSDLMAGRELVFLARYRGPATGSLELSGVADGTRRVVRTTFDARDADASHAFVPRLWAVQRVAALDAARRRLGPDPELDDELRTLGERYGIPTALTSYLVLEPDAPMPHAPMPGAPTPIAARSGGAPRSAPAPSAVAFESARRTAEQRKAVTLAATDSMLAADESDAVRTGRTRFVDGRAFDLRDATWTDRRLLTDGAWRPALTVRVRPFSAAWAALAREVPALAAAFALGERVRVRGTTVLVEVVPDGREAIDAATLTAVRERW